MAKNQRLSKEETEQQRLAALQSYRLLDTAADRDFDDLNDLTASYFQVPMATLALVDRDRVWFKSSFGVDFSEIPRGQGFSDVVIESGEMVVVEDTLADPRFASHPLVAGGPHIRFYAGAPLVNPDGHIVGTLSITDLGPRHMGAAEKTALAALARQAMAQMELHRRKAQAEEALTKLSLRNRELALQNRALEQLNSGANLSEVLTELVQQVEDMHPDAMCSVLLADREGARLIPTAMARLRPNIVLPPTGIPIGERSGSCGTAAFRGARVVTENIWTDPLWEGHRQHLDAKKLGSCWSQPIKDRDGNVQGTFAIYHRQPSAPTEEQITQIERYANLAALSIEQQRISERVHRLAFFDGLTHLPNRRLMEDRLAQSIASSGRSGTFCALMFIDLDNFKTINDTLGHAKGDMLLAQVATRLAGCLRQEDTVARLGGDEFVVMLVNLSRDETESIAKVNQVTDKVVGAIGRGFRLLDDFCRCTISIGITLYKGPEITVNALLKQADLAMYRSKAAGRNSIHFFDPAMEAKAIERATLESDLRNAIRRNEFTLNYQPLVGNKGEVLGAEVLLRWQHPKRGAVAPAEFIPLAEETGLILPLGKWALETACEQLARWAGIPGLRTMTVSVNISAQQIKQRDFAEMVLEVLRRTGAPARRLKLELTESLLIDDIEDIIGKMQVLKEGGVGFSLDDFGTGYSSLSYLKRLPLDQLKIDQAFVRDIMGGSHDAAIARTIVVLARNLGFGVVAEGVEIESQRCFLGEIGCDAYQGRFFSAPLPLQDFEQYCQEHTA
jgi:diguanylate cyclase (GGDEF)-like protein